MMLQGIISFFSMIWGYFFFRFTLMILDVYKRPKALVLLYPLFLTWSWTLILQVLIIPANPPQPWPTILILSTIDVLITIGFSILRISEWIHYRLKRKIPKTPFD